MKKKIVKINAMVAGELERSDDVRFYLYRIASMSMDRVVLEKHSVLPSSNFDRNITAELSDDTKVGTITQKVVVSIIADITKRVDNVAVGFEMKEKTIRSIDFSGVEILIATETCSVL